MSRTTIRSWPSLATALLFILGACYVLFRELLHGAELTPSHVLTALALLAAIAAGHSWLAALRAGRLLLGLGLALVAIAALGYIVISSAARNAETGAAKAASIAAANAQRPAVEKKRAEALFLLDPCPAGFPASATGLKCGLRQARDAECATGKGGRCDGRAYSVTTYEAAIQGYDRQLAALGPAAEPHAGYRQAAALWVRLRGGDVRVIEDTLVLVMPFLAVLITEVGTIVFLSMALGHRPAAERQVTASANDEATVMIALPANDHPQPPAPDRGRKDSKNANSPAPAPASKSSGTVVAFPGPANKASDAAHPVLAALAAAGGEVPSHEALARLMGVTGGEASKRVAEVAALLVIERRGKKKALRLRG